MNILHIGNKESEAGIQEMDWPNHIQSEPNLSSAAAYKKNKVSKGFDLVLMSEEIWLDSPSKAAMEVKKNILSNGGCIIAILEDETSEKVNRLYRAGVNDYIVKPLIESKLLFRLNRISRGKDELDREGELLQAIRQLEKTNEKLKSLTDLDSLTGIYNRRFFHSFISERWEGQRDENFFVIMADIDKFKAFNDTYGHLKGDQCLKQVAQSLKKTSDKLNAMTARFGGEEFVVVVHTPDGEQVLSLAEEIRSSIEKLCVADEDSECPAKVTISLGVSSGSLNGISSYKELIDQADQCLYEAKRLGGNQVVQADIKTAVN
ncbi:diguanylate cyclase [Bacillus sp. FJAT-42376]|uniref:diguanylate cyclase n=1 Tax=Bacillus sp. FJAT-42376 TaxID=2014076 RepID=UPI000F508A15|nr:diguanylate cyclase [Bacillus sp. FJAT-42376]AZB42448.1 diguanylate cyclase [Bacillus sp. FJAT-42376]